MHWQKAVFKSEKGIKLYEFKPRQPRQNNSDVPNNIDYMGWVHGKLINIWKNLVVGVEV